MKRVISIIMVVVLLISIVTMMAFGLSANGFTYTVEDGEATITAYNNNAAQIEIPDTLGGYPVTKIGAYAFANRAETAGTDISSLRLPAGLREIGAGAFDINSTVTSLVIPDSVEVIGARAFHCWIKLSNLEFAGNHLKTIGKWAFRNAHSLNSLALPDALETIEEGAFSYCTSLNSVSIPASVTSLEREAFLSCTSLQEVIINNRNMAIGDNAFDLTLSTKNADNRSLTVSGYKNSSAQRFAAAEGFTFKELAEPVVPEEPDDPNPNDPPAEAPGVPSATIGTAASGPYYVKITYTVTKNNEIESNYLGFNRENNDSAGISVLCRAINGTAAQDKEYKWDIKNQMGTKGTYTLSAALEGFPTMLYGYLDDNNAFSTAAFSITSLQVGSSASSLKQVWRGAVELSSKINAFGVSVDWDNHTKANYFNSDGNNKVSSSSGAWEKPYAASMSAQFENAEAALSAESESVSNLFTYHAVDQYGVEMDTSLCKNIALAAPESGAEMVALSYKGGSGSAQCSKQLHLAREGENVQEIALRFTWRGVDSVKTDTESFLLRDESYAVQWLDESGNVLKQSQVYYGDMPGESVPAKEADEVYHYTEGAWSPALQAASADARYQAVYTAVEHSFLKDESRCKAASCTAEGVNMYVCLACGYEKAEVLPRLEHRYAATQVKAATCTEEGYTVYTCSNCNTSYQGDIVAALGHDFTKEDPSEDALRSTPSKDKNGTFYFTCTRCGEINRSYGEFFEVPSASVSGSVNMQGQFKPVTVSLLLGDEVVRSFEIALGSSGAFCFYGLEPATYTLLFSGESTTFAALDALDLSGAQKVDLTKSENAQVSEIIVTNGDVNHDGLVDIGDISVILSAAVYGSVDKDADINNDSVVNITDIGIALMSENYGSSSKRISM